MRENIPQTGAGKSRIRRTPYLICGVLLSGLLFMGIALLTLDDDHYKWLLIKAVELTTDYRITISGPFSLDLSKTAILSAQKIRIQTHSDSPSVPDAYIEKIKVNVKLSSFFYGPLYIRGLFAEDVDIHWVMYDALPHPENNLQKRSSTVWNIPILDGVQLRNIRIRAAGSNAGRSPDVFFKELRMDDFQNSGPFNVKGSGTVNNNNFAIKGQLGPLAQILDPRGDYPLDLALEFAGLRLNLYGTVEDPLHGKGLDLKISGAEDNVANLLKALRIDIPIAGRLHIAGKVLGNADSPELSHLNLILYKEKGLSSRVSGSIGDLTGGEEVDLVIDGSCEDTTLIRTIFPEGLVDLEKLTFRSTLVGSADKFDIRIIEAKGITKKNLEIKARGKAGLGPVREGLAVSGLDLKLEISSPTTEAAKPLLVDFLPEMGPVTGEGRITGMLHQLSLEDISLAIGEPGTLQLKCEGRIGRLMAEGDQTVSNIHLSLAVKAKGTRPISSALDLRLPELGPVSMHGEISGSAAELMIANIRISSKNKHGMTMDLTGTIGPFKSESESSAGDVNMRILVNAPHMGSLEALLGASIFPGLGPVRTSAAIMGNTQIITLENIDIRVGGKGPVTGELRGRIDRIPLEHDRPISGFLLSGSLNAESTSALSRYLGVIIPDLGPVKKTWKIVDRGSGTYGLDDVKLSIGSRGGFLLEGNGNIKSVVKSNALDVKGIHMDFVMGAPDTRFLSSLTGQSFPDLGTFKGNFSLVGSTEHLAIKDMDIRTHSPEGLQISANGGISRIDPGAELPIQGVDIQVRATGPGVKAIPGINLAGLPELGSWLLSAHVEGLGNGTDIHSFQFQSGGREKPTFFTDGKIEHTWEGHRMVLKAGFDTHSRLWLQEWIKWRIPEDHRLKGRISAEGTRGDITIHDFHVMTSDLDRMFLKGNGKLLSVDGGPYKFDMKIQSEIKDLQVIEALIGSPMPRLGPVGLSGRLAGDRKKLAFDGETRCGRTLLNMDVDVILGDSRPRVVADISSGAIYLSDFGLSTDVTSKEDVLIDRAGTRTSQRLFSETPYNLDLLKAVDLNLRVNAEKIIGSDSGLNALKLRLALLDGRMEISPARVGYADGAVSIELTLDTKRPKPELRLKATAEDVDINSVFAHMHRPLLLGGHLNLVVDLKGSGVSPHEMASSLEGEFGFSIENGRIKRGIDFLGADAIDMVTLLARVKKYHDLNCLAVRFLFKEGKGTSRMIFLDTKDTRIRGVGSIDLSSEIMDVVLKPEPKKALVKLSSPVGIKGPVADPSVVVIPYMEAARVAGDILFPYAIVPARALGHLWYLMKKDKDEQSPCMIQGTADE